MLKIGKINYLNVFPLYNSVSSENLIEGEPSYLNNLLRQQIIDISPSSSFEYIKNPENYLILNNFSISSREKVLSVVLILKNKIEQIYSETIYLSPASATTNVLLQIILKEFFNITNVKFKYLKKNIFHENVNHLLIGDEALKIYFEKRKNIFIYDIGYLWYKFTKLPFVFALWLINKDSITNKKEYLDEFIEKLMKNKSNIVFPEKYKNFKKAQIEEYFKYLDYNLEDSHLKSLKIFSELCKKYNFIEKIPLFKFY